jgi:hypothetical protein
MCAALLYTLTLMAQPACPAAPGPALFTEANGARALVTLGGHAHGGGAAVFAVPGRVVAGVEWGPAYVVLDASVLASPDPAARVGLRLRF